MVWSLKNNLYKCLLLVSSWYDRWKIVNKQVPPFSSWYDRWKILVFLYGTPRPNVTFHNRWMNGPPAACHFALVTRQDTQSSRFQNSQQPVRLTHSKTTVSTSNVSQNFCTVSFSVPVSDAGREGFTNTHWPCGDIIYDCGCEIRADPLLSHKLLQLQLLCPRVRIGVWVWWCAWDGCDRTNTGTIRLGFLRWCAC